MRSGREISVVERQRLAAVISDWLALEKRRLVPFTVQSVEITQEFLLQGLKFNLRLDRVDQLENGKTILIDYKSGEQKLKKLETEEGRPQEPQLLVYASARGADVEGIFFGQVRPRSVDFIGYSKDTHYDGKQAKVLADWPGRQQQWNTVIESLAAQFCSGRCGGSAAQTFGDLPILRHQAILPDCGSVGGRIPG